MWELGNLVYRRQDVKTKMKMANIFHDNMALLKKVLQLYLYF